MINSMLGFVAFWEQLCLIGLFGWLYFTWFFSLKVHFNSYEKIFQKCSQKMRQFVCNLQDNCKLKAVIIFLFFTLFLVWCNIFKTLYIWGLTLVVICLKLQIKVMLTNYSQFFMFYLMDYFWLLLRVIGRILSIIL